MLYSEQIRREIIDNGLVSGCPSLERQLQSRWLELTLGWVEQPVAGGGYEGWLAAGGDFSAAPHQPMSYDADGWLYLAQGSYVAQLNELLQLPDGIRAKAHPHPGLERASVGVQPAVWHSGYKGRVSAMMVVQHRSGFRVQRGAPLLRLEFEYLPVGRYSPETITLGAG